MGRINSVIIIMKRGRLLSCAVVFLRHWLGGGNLQWFEWRSKVNVAVRQITHNITHIRLLRK